MAQPRMRISATVLGAPDPQDLGAFYARLLGWKVVENQDARVMVRPPSGGRVCHSSTSSTSSRRSGPQYPANSK